MFSFIGALRPNACLYSLGSIPLGKNLVMSSPFFKAVLTLVALSFPTSASGKSLIVMLGIFNTPAYLFVSFLPKTAI